MPTEPVTAALHSMFKELNVSVQLVSRAESLFRLSFF